MKAVRNSSAIFVNMVVCFVMLGVFVTMAAPKFVDMKFRSVEDDKETLVSYIKSGITSFYSKNLEYPSALDRARFGEAAPENRFFTEVLKTGVAKGWHKIANNYYILPKTSSYFYYNNRTGEFLEH